MNSKDLALGFAIGTFWSCIPIFILHWPPAIWTADLFRKSKLAATAGVFLSNPFTIPIHYSTAWLLGHLLVSSSNETRTDFTSGSAILKAMLDMGWVDLAVLQLGGLVMGVVLFPPAYFISYYVARGVRNARAAKRGNLASGQSTEN